MELGGNWPGLIFEDADIERALDAALFTIFSFNASAAPPVRASLFSKASPPKFVKRFAERANRLRVAIRMIPIPRSAPISQQHWDKVSGDIRLGIEEGAYAGGRPDKPFYLPAHLKGCTSCAENGAGGRR
ncbi:aldehyde dehydrogenase family protein [Shigella flexneri]